MLRRRQGIKHKVLGSSLFFVIMADTPDKPRYWLNTLRHELFQQVLPWWLNKSLDKEGGGYFNCIYEDGSLFDTTKYIWLQGRQVWMLAKIYGDPKYDDRFFQDQGLSEINNHVILKAAIHGAEFLVKHAIKEDGQVWFSLNQKGEPVQFQRKPWGACFLCMGLIELARVMPESMATEAAKFYKQGVDTFRLILQWFEAPWLLGTKFGSGQPATSSLAVPMILLNMCFEMRQCLGDPDENDATPLRLLEGDEDVVLLDICEQKEKWCVDEIKKHIKYDESKNGDKAPTISKVLETVGPNGEILDGATGRLINPGHVIEAGWFLMQYASQIKSDDLFKLGQSVATWAFDYGWDSDEEKAPNGGILYFLDASKKYSPMELEWDMKLWWPHTEAMIAFAMAYKKTGDQRMWQKFQKVADYSLQTFKDHDNGGEWFGYCNRKGELTHRFKGGAYKGCFHIPRSLWMCVSILDDICNKE